MCAANVESMFSANNTVPWHGLGTVIKDPVVAEEAIKLAGLDWEVKKQPLEVNVSDWKDAQTSHVPAPEWMATVRTDNMRVLGVVGKNYQIVQNIEAFKFMDELVGPGRLLQYETAGSLAFGRKVWMLATVKDLCVEPVPGDIVQPYLLLANGHDGRLELSVSWTSVRVVCQNTLMLALGGAKHKISLRHTGNMGRKREQAQTVLGLTRKVVERAEDVMKHLALKQMGDKVLNQFLLDLVPNDTSRAENTRELLKKLTEQGAGTDIKGVKGTAWGALNAVTAYTTHLRTVRGGSKGPQVESEKRTDSVWWGSANDLNQKAVRLLTAV